MPEFVAFAQAFSSKGEARRMIQNNGVSLNKVKIQLERQVNLSDLIFDKYILRTNSFYLFNIGDIFIYILFHYFLYSRLYFIKCSNFTF